MKRRVLCILLVLTMVFSMAPLAAIAETYPTDIWLDQHAFEGYAGCHIDLIADNYPNGADVTVVWTSSDNSVATVDQNGHVEIVGGGEAIITASVGEGIKDSCIITGHASGPIALDEERTVTFVPKEKREAAEAFRFVPTETGIYRMYSYDIVTTTDEDKAVDPRLWVYDSEMMELEYNDDGGEDVNVDGQCELIAGETYIFMIEPYDYEAAGTVKVKLIQCPPAESIEIDGGDLVLDQGDTVDFYDTQSPPGCGIEEVTYTTSDPNVVRLEDRKGFAVGAGEAIITATTTSGLTDSITITVLPVPTLSIDTTTTLNCLGSDGNAWQKYCFVPEESGIYCFESFNIVGDWDPEISLSTMHNLLRYNKDKGEDPNFYLYYELVAGESYYVEVTVNVNENVDEAEDGSVDFKVTKLDESEFPEVKTNKSYDVVVDIPALNQYFRFTPVVSGLYTFFSSKDDSNEADPKIEVLLENFEIFGSDDDDGGNSNYNLEIELLAGETYYIKSYIYSCDNVGSYVMNIEYLGDDVVGISTVENAEIVNDEVKTIGADFAIISGDIVDAPVLFFVNGGAKETYRELSFDDDNRASYDFSSDDFADGVDAKTFVFGVCVDGEWHYSNEFIVSYSVTFDITFDANGGTGIMDGATVAEGEEYTLPENSFVAPENMQFKAWSVDGVEKAAGDVITITADTTVIAVWENLPDVHVHDEGEWTTLEDGSKELRCTACGELLDTEPAPEQPPVDPDPDAPHVHDEGEWITLEDGSKELRCTACGELLDTEPAPEQPPVDPDPEILLGDVNQDGVIDMFDYLLVKSFYFEVDVPTADEALRADINEDGEIDMFDYLEVKTAYFNS